MLAPRSPRARTAGRCRARRRGCALHAHTHIHSGEGPLKRSNPLAQHAPVALAASGLDQAVSIAGSRSLQGQAGGGLARARRTTHFTTRAKLKAEALDCFSFPRSIPPVLQWARPEGYEASLHTRASSINVYAGHRPVQWRGSGAKKRR